MGGRQRGRKEGGEGEREEQTEGGREGGKEPYSSKNWCFRFLIKLFCMEGKLRCGAVGSGRSSGPVIYKLSLAPLISLPLGASSVR